MLRNGRGELWGLTSMALMLVTSASRMWMLVRDLSSASSEIFLSVAALLRTRPTTMLLGSLEYWRTNSYCW